MKYLIQFSGTLVILYSFQSNIEKTVGLLIWWYFTFKPIAKKELVLFFSMNIIFSTLDYISLSRGLFTFSNPDIGPLPYFEFFMWGFYVLNTYRQMASTVIIPNKVNFKIVFLNILFMMPFVFIINYDLLSLFSFLILLFIVLFIGTIDDLKFIAYFLFIGTAIEYFGVWNHIWYYQKNFMGEVPFWYLSLWGGVGFFSRRIVLPILNFKTSSSLKNNKDKKIINWFGVFSKLNTIPKFLYLISDGFRKNNFERIPEPQLIMTEVDSVKHFNNEGRHYLIPIYYFNAYKLHLLLPYQGTLLDLGSGSAQFLIFLAQCRPDIKIYGVELSKNMRELAQKEILNVGLENRIEIIEGDMLNLSILRLDKIDVISSIFSLHHLSDYHSLEKCLYEIVSFHRKFNSKIYFFDHERANSLKTAEIFPELFTPNANISFKTDSKNSIKASFKVTEIYKVLHDLGSAKNSKYSYTFLFPFYQLHQIKCKDIQKLKNKNLWINKNFPLKIKFQIKMLYYIEYICRFINYFRNLLFK